MRGLFITGTDTGVGKTFVTAAIIRLVRKAGLDAVGLKPFATGAVPTAVRDPSSQRQRDRDGWISEDARELFEASGGVEPIEAINPVLFRAPRAPKVAAEMEGESVDTVAVLESIRAVASRHDAVAIEGVGGLLVPLTADKTVADFAAEVGLPLLIVGRAGLGAINHAALTVNEARRRGLKVAGVILNAHAGPEEEELVQSNKGEIERLCGVRVLAALPYAARGSDAAEKKLARCCDCKALLLGE